MPQRPSRAVERDDFVALRAPDHRGVRRILFFRVDDPTPGKNRMHVDLAARDPAAFESTMGRYGAAREALEKAEDEWLALEILREELES